MQSLMRQVAVPVLGALAVAGAGVAGVTQTVMAHGEQRSHHETADQRARGGALVKAVREVTEKYKDVAVAEADKYQLAFGCVSGPDYGAMGLHYVNFPLAMDGELDVAKPEIVIYEPQPNGKPKLIGADYLVFAEAWHAKHKDETPKLGGQLMHLIEAPNRYGLPAFYTLHVWAWKESSTGPFVNWHPNVSCAAYDDQKD